MKIDKSQKQLIVLGGILAAIVVALGLLVFSPEPFTEMPYQPKTVDTDIPRAVVEHPEYGQLRLLVDLPLVPGRLGRDDPFEPY